MAESEQVKAMRATPEGYFTVRWGQPEYTDWLDESMSWKETCYIGDWTFLWERRFRGPDAIKLFDCISPNNFRKFDIGQSKHVVHPTEAGHVIHEGILTRLGEEELMLFGRGSWYADYMLRKLGLDAESEADDWFNFQVSGPTALQVCEKAAGTRMRDTKYMHNQEVEIAGLKVNALRQGMAGEIGYELQGPTEHAQAVYDAIVEAGQEFGIRKLGGRAVFINHLEACFPTIVTDYMPAIFGDDMADYLAEFRAAMPPFASTFNIAGSYEGQEISDWYRNQVELGWGKSINLEHDFIGKEALAAEKANPTRQIRTLVWNPDDVADVHASLYREGDPYTFMEMPRDQRGFMWADKVLSNDSEAGVSTSRGYSYFFREMLSLAVMDIEQAEIGSEVVVVWGNPGGPQKEIRARVQPAPYKQDASKGDLKKAR
jgi:vanillate/3-O-methylgallate O-demethylase